MRSRYTAYTRKDFGYLVRTWDARTRPDSLHEESGLEWIGLSILNTRKGLAEDEEGVVEFVARFRVNDMDDQLHEVSRFGKCNGEWFYLDGEADNPGKPVHAPKIGRNEPCPCGSGKKFKKCCGSSIAA
jgi:SEC-C motif-containing protein